MGVIRRQGIKQSIAVFVGSAIGGLNNLYFFPDAFSSSQIGLLRFFQDTAIMLAPFLMLGTSGLATRFFPAFKDEARGHRGFLSLLLLWAGIGTSLFLLIALLFGGPIRMQYARQSPLVSQYYYWGLPIIIAYAFTALLTQYTANFLRITVPALLAQLVKPAMTILALLYLWHHIGFDTVVHSVSLWYIAALLLLIAYIRHLGQWHLTGFRPHVSRDQFREMASYALYGLLASTGSNLIIKLDTFMLASVRNLHDTGIYTISAYIGSIIMIPTNALINISAPIISRAWHDHDTKEIETVYKKASLNLSLVGLLIILLITASLGDLFDFMPNGDIYRVGVPVVYIILGSRLIDMVTSVNNEIIGYSKHYRVNFFALISAGLLNVALNLLLIPRLGIVGAAWATAISVLLFNAFKLGFIYKRFGIHPFSRRQRRVAAIFAVTAVVLWLMPDTGRPLVNMALKSAVGIIVFVTLTVRWQASPDFTELLPEFLRKLLGS